MKLHPPGKPVGVLRLKFNVERAVYLIQTRPGINLPHILSLLHYRRLGLGVLEHSRSDDQLQHVIHRYDTGGSTIFVHHDGQRLSALGKRRKQIVQRNGLRDKKRVLYLSRIHINHALDVIRRAAEHRKIAVLRACEGGGTRRLVKIDVISDYVDARRHLVVRTEFGETEHALHHLGIGRRHFAVLRRGLHDRHQFPVRQCAPFTRQHRGECPGTRSQHGIEGREDSPPEPEHACIKGRYLLCIFKSKTLRRYFSEKEK